MQAIRADYFGRRAIGMILGVSAMVGAIGQAIGPLVAGILGDATGDYELGFTVLSGIALIGAAVFWLAKRPLPPNSPPPAKATEQSPAHTTTQTTGTSAAAPV